MVSGQPADIGAIPFQGKHPDERFVLFFRQHWVRLVRPFLQTVTATVLLLGIGYIGLAAVDAGDALTRRVFFLTIAGAFTLVHMGFLARFYRHFLTVFILTDRRLHRIKKTLVAFDDHQSIDLAALQDIRRSQLGMVQNMLGFGTLILEAQETVVRIHFVPRIAEHHARLLQLKKQYVTGTRPVENL